MLLASVSTQTTFSAHDHPLRRRPCGCSGGRWVPVKNFVLTGIVIAFAVLLWGALPLEPVRACHQGGVRERRVRPGLQASRPTSLSLVNMVLASLVPGHDGHPRRLPSPRSRDTLYLPLLIVPALAAALFARLTSFGNRRACGLADRGDRVAASSTASHLSRGSRLSQGVADPGYEGAARLRASSSLRCFFAELSLPTRGELVEQRLPDVPRPEAPVRSSRSRLTISVRDPPLSCCRTTSVRR